MSKKNAEEKFFDCIKQSLVELNSHKELFFDILKSNTVEIPKKDFLDTDGVFSAEINYPSRPTEDGVFIDIKFSIVACGSITPYGSEKFKGSLPLFDRKGLFSNYLFLISSFIPKEPNSILNRDSENYFTESYRGHLCATYSQNMIGPYDTHRPKVKISKEEWDKKYNLMAESVGCMIDKIKDSILNLDYDSAIRIRERINEPEFSKNTENANNIIPVL